MKREKATKLENYECEDCSGETFEVVLQLKKRGPGRKLLPVQVLACKTCGSVVPDSYVQFVPE